MNSGLRSGPCPHFGGANSHFCDHHQAVSDGMHEHAHKHTLSICRGHVLAPRALQLSVTWSQSISPWGGDRSLQSQRQVTLTFHNSDADLCMTFAGHASHLAAISGNYKQESVTTGVQRDGIRPPNCNKYRYNQWRSCSLFSLYVL